jgi:hypothetical protein
MLFTKYSARRLLGSKIIESAAYCNQISLAQVYINRAQNTSITWIICLLLSLLCRPKVILLSGGQTLYFPRKKLTAHSNCEFADQILSKIMFDADLVICVLSYMRFIVLSTILHICSWKFPFLMGPILEFRVMFWQFSTFWKLSFFHM